MASGQKKIIFDKLNKILEMALLKNIIRNKDAFILKEKMKMNRITGKEALKELNNIERQLDVNITPDPYGKLGLSTKNIKRDKIIANVIKREYSQESEQNKDYMKKQLRQLAMDVSKIIYKLVNDKIISNDEASKINKIFMDKNITVNDLLKIKMSLLEMLTGQRIQETMSRNISPVNNLQLVTISNDLTRRKKEEREKEREIEKEKAFKLKEANSARLKALENEGIMKQKLKQQTNETKQLENAQQQRIIRQSIEELIDEVEQQLVYNEIQEMKKAGLSNLIGNRTNDKNQQMNDIDTNFVSIPMDTLAKGEEFGSAPLGLFLQDPNEALDEKDKPPYLKRKLPKNDIDNDIDNDIEKGIGKAKLVDEKGNEYKDMKDYYSQKLNNLYNLPTNAIKNLVNKFSMDNVLKYGTSANEIAKSISNSLYTSYGIFIQPSYILPSITGITSGLMSTINGNILKPTRKVMDEQIKQIKDDEKEFYKKGTIQRTNKIEQQINPVQIPDPKKGYESEYNPTLGVPQTVAVQPIKIVEGPLVNAVDILSMPRPTGGVLSSTDWVYSGDSFQNKYEINRTERDKELREMTIKRIKESNKKYGPIFS